MDGIEGMDQFDELLRQGGYVDEVPEAQLASEAAKSKDQEQEEDTENRKQDSNSDWHAQNLERKKKAALFSCVTDLVQRLVVLRLYANLAHNLLHCQLKLSGSAWEVQERTRAAQGNCRRFKVLETAVGMQSGPAGKCFAEAQQLLWSIPYALPSRFFTFSARACLLRMVSALLCTLEASTLRYHRGFPYCLFRIMISYLDAEEIYQMPTCRHDEMSADFFHQFPSVGSSQTPAARAVLESLALSIDVDIADVECAHSGTREFTKQRGRGHVPTLSEVSAKTMCKWVAKHHYIASESAETKTSSDGGGDGDALPPARPKRPGAGGAWRAFVHKRAKNTRLSPTMMRDLAAEYSQLSAAEKQCFVELGRLMTLEKKYQRLTGQDCKTFDEQQQEQLGPIVEPVEQQDQDSSMNVLLQLANLSEPQSSLLRMGDSFAERFSAFKADMARERKLQLSQYEKTTSLDGAGGSLVMDISGHDHILVDQINRFGGPGLVNGLQQVPCTDTVHHLEWKMPIIPFVQVWHSDMIAGWVCFFHF